MCAIINCFFSYQIRKQKMIDFFKKIQAFENVHRLIPFCEEGLYT